MPMTRFDGGRMPQGDAFDVPDNFPRPVSPGRRWLGRASLTAVVAAGVFMGVGDYIDHSHDNLGDCQTVAVVVPAGGTADGLVAEQNPDGLGPNRWAGAVEAVQKQGAETDERGRHTLIPGQLVVVAAC
jgi:hypothetical protein